MFEFVRKITLEPVIFLMYLATCILDGAQIQTDLLMSKLCTTDLNLTEEICNNLSSEENNDYEIHVQKKLQEFQMINQWLNSAPTFLYSLFIGGLSDKFGRRKPLMLIPLFGQMINFILYFINYR